MALGLNDPGFWDAAYAGRRPHWDLNGPAPVFRRLAESGAYPPGRMIVLGAGRGHDAFLFARHGFAVTALDFAPEATREMRARAAAEGPLEVLQADFFDLPRPLDGTFDYALEYVFYCAIAPARRTEYADAVARLLKPGGLFIDLAFPLDGRTGGPPFTVSVDELLTLFTARGFSLLRRETPPDSVKPRRGAEELLVLEKNQRAP